MALIVGGALNPELADSDTSMKLTELMTDTIPPVEGDGWGKTNNIHHKKIVKTLCDTKKKICHLTPLHKGRILYYNLIGEKSTG